MLHSIKGVSGNFGAIQLYKVTIDAEEITHAEFLDGVTKHVTLLNTEIHRACEALNDYSYTLA